MSQKLEKLFKESLQNEEAAFDPKAWSAMEARLNQTMPVSPVSSILKWTGISAVVLGVVGTALWLGNSEEKKTTNKVEKTIVESPKQADNIQLSEVKTDNKNPQQVVVAPIQENEQPTPEKVEKSNSSVIVAQKEKAESVKANPAVQVEPKDQEPKQEKILITQTETKPVLLPKIGAKCQGEKITINNTNEVPLVLSAPNGLPVKVNPGQKKEIRLEDFGLYSISGGNKSYSFGVSATPKSLIEQTESMFYEEGVPTYTFFTPDNTSSATWTIDGRVVGKGKDVNVNLFKAGTHQLKLNLVNDAGCQSSSLKNILVQEDYNLLAPSGFSPDRLDARVSTFMPVALKERNSGFNLIIIDPQSGAVVFQSDDASFGWDGIDGRNGQPAPSNSMFIWKVVLEKPLPGEKSEYRGTITVKR